MSNSRSDTKSSDSPASTPAKSDDKLSASDIRLLTTTNYAAIISCIWQGRRVVVKQLLPSHQKSEKHINKIKREAQHLADIDHKHIVKFHTFISGPTYRVVMEYHPLNLHHSIDKYHQTYSWDVICFRLGLGLAEAMAYLNKKNILHRDLKPLNIMHTVNFEVKLIDFDVAIKTENDDPIVTKLVGTVVYLAPETFLHNQYSKQTDVYSFGLSLWEMMSGKSPFYELGSSYEIIYPELKKGYRNPIPDKMPKLMADIFKSCCEFESNKRPSFDEIVSRFKNNK